MADCSIASRTNDLNKHVSEWRGIANRWTENTVKELQTKKDEFNSVLRHSREETFQLEQRKREAEVKKIRKHEELEQEEKEIEMLKKELHHLKERESEVAKQHSQLRERLEREDASLKEISAKYQEKAKNHSEKFDSLSNAITRFKKGLGLEFQRGEENRLRFIMTQIDPNDMTREFSFTAFIDNQVYLIEHCVPAIPQEQLDPLVENLNKRNNFGRFCKYIRILWKTGL